MTGDASACGLTGLPTRHPAPTYHGLLGLLVLLMPVVTAGQGIDVDRADLFLRGGRLASGAWGCGFAILANHRTRDDPHVEWDINVEQVNNGSHILVSVTAASFSVTHRLRTARAPATQLVFAADQDPQPMRVRFAGPVDAEGAVRGALAGDEASRLFAAVGAGSFITMVLDFPDRQPESLRFHFVRESAGPAQGALDELCRPVAAAAR
jgi:hypothetical protein